MIQSLAIAFGGFFVYAAVVVPIATEVIGGTTQGFVTQRVTNVLNALAGIATAMLAWDLFAHRRMRSHRSQTALLIATVCIGACTLTLAWLHGQLDNLLDPSDMTVLDSETFYSLHRVYLWIATVQWVTSLIASWIVIAPPHRQQLRPKQTADNPPT
ncbi:MAG: hypothetical protein Aurels2KO_22520 [Aureliella sp.]